MRSQSINALPSYLLEKLTLLGDVITLSRKAREETQDEFAKRCLMTKATLRNIEKGNPNVAFGCYLQVFNVLGMADVIMDVLIKEKNIEEIVLLKSALPQRIRKIKRIDNDF